MRSLTSLPGLSLSSSLAAFALTCSAAQAQVAALPTRPPLTATGGEVAADIIQIGLRGNRSGNRFPANRAPQSPAMPAQTPAPPAQAPPAQATTNALPVQLATQEATDFYGRLDLAIEVSSRRYLTANVHSPWQIFHGLLALKKDFELNLGGSKVNAIQWIATSDPRFDNQSLLMKTPHGGKFHSFTRPYAFEGHPAQFLALLSQSDLPLNYAFKTGQDRITVGDIVNNTMKEVNSREEVTWVLWALQHYLKPDAQWVNQYNEPWSMERLVQIETAAPVNGAPCGGNHRLFALTRTRDKHLKNGGQLNGVWAQADHKIRQHIEIARSLQNYDGSFSARFYETSGHTTDLNQRFNTSGHTMEFLSIGLPESRLQETWVKNAVTSLCNDLIANRQRQIDCGPLYHTLNSLIIYRERTRQFRPSVQTQEIADKPIDPLVASGKPATPVTATPTTAPAVSATAGPGAPGTTPNPATPQSTPAATLTAPAANSPVGVPELPKSQPSLEALIELKLDDSSRARLNALTAPRPNAPAPAEANSGAIPVLQIALPVSALKPENAPR